MPRDFEDHCWKDVIDAKTLEVYRGYERAIGIGDQPALLAIDLYQRVYQGGARPVHELHRQHRGTCGEHAWNAIEPTLRLFEAARAAGLPVIYSTDDLAAKLREGRRFEAHAFDIKEEFAPRPGDLVITKQHASVFHGTPLVSNLNQLGVRSLIVCGESTSGCVRATVVDAVSYGFDTVVVEECTFDRSELSHKVSLFDIHMKYGDVVTLDDAASYLAGTGA